MITWTVTTRPENSPELLTASGADTTLADAKRAAADAVRYALLDAAEHTSPDNGCAPSYLVTLDGTCALIVGLGRCRPANYNGVLDSLERFDGTAPPHLLYT
ncbi:hypothetical protein CH260_24070 [Rhodococcus sp. 05-2256-B2]|uniref:hypothetical protein n=1 Tax=unclassified Rhodococcus (in: high G+C Gram-positive bacteria) TaxID=192944 RepID=UPI000B9AC27A|nr:MULTISPECIES: hypothetical protein [unclassified Rhodococcus (in: high G+C Gram-positive bacteria)]OZD86505.1 hypothetical protein CH257_26155 [Rhodococcus sp. 05-2256-B3]OZD90765.1 hypothetical protein CH260_24070 [Rhodococcus sp. 05-2256-B2]OZD94478.1 hypothetical protein CH258_00290 [Rhodococcus sp. 05-2256-B4]OZE07182.1 hypothetical protein CH285_04950 [Rhodococcus sp. 05-2256-B1]